MYFDIKNKARVFFRANISIIIDPLAELVSKDLSLNFLVTSCDCLVGLRFF